MTEKDKVLVCNSSTAEAEMIGEALEKAGFDVDIMSNTHYLVPTLLWKKHKVCIISTEHLPENGYHVASSVHERHIASDVGIILTGDRHNRRALSEALMKYADAVLDVVYDLPLLAGMVTALIRREAARPVNYYAFAENQFHVGSLLINIANRIVTFGDLTEQLTPSQFQVFMLLITNRGVTIDRESIIKNTKGKTMNLTSRTVDNVIYQLRKKLQNMHVTISTISKQGYLLTIDS